jgi:hypothetical protein
MSRLIAVFVLLFPHFAAASDGNQAGNGSVIHHHERIRHSRELPKSVHHASRMRSSGRQVTVNVRLSP